RSHISVKKSVERPRGWPKKRRSSIERQHTIGSRLMDEKLDAPRVAQPFAAATKTALLISTYEMGRQPFGLASPAAWLRAAGWHVVPIDPAKQRLPEDVVAAAEVVAFHLPMHTATRLAAPVIGRVRRLSPGARVAAYGLYAPLNEAWLRSLGV